MKDDFEVFKMNKGIPMAGKALILGTNFRASSSYFFLFFSDTPISNFLLFFLFFSYFTYNKQIFVRDLF